MAIPPRELKEAFVSNLNGTSLVEVALGSFLSPLCLIHRGLILILCHHLLHLHPMTPLLLDFFVIILPLVLSCTVLSSVLHVVIITMTLVAAGLFYNIYTNSKHQRSTSSFIQSGVHFHQVPFITLFRVFVNINTAISILAVDFNVFPRRYAKTETYGTGVMDFGVGGFVFANALVSPEARGKNTSGLRINHIWKQLLSVWPLMALGIGRLMTVKMTGYHEHETEYGVHWNFFFTLAIVRIVSSMLLTVLPANRSWVFASVICGLYQLTLETSSLKDFVIHNNDRDKSFLLANKEGIISTVGYVAIYLIGVQVGLYVMQPRSRVREWLRALLTLLLTSFMLYAVLCTCQTFVEPVSRRLANLPFCLWSVAQSVFLMSCLGLADMIVLFCQRMSGCHFLTSSCTLQRKESETNTDLDQQTSKMERHGLIQAISRNQLFFFLLSNVLTGLTNSTIDTLHCGSLFSVFVLLFYMLINCFFIYVLHSYDITVKFW
ncbi:phosphatidylinositol-glycan biosynthesis class W protein isoform X2 [Gouania willdenowi]|uniref:Phosphatidylinositol-glycan biosynthesis class W protein n=1 Tax=Gouania willdenowi TaxID=441366 RepID=A0A8C5GR37_GOUWI|nr:phosphatidylinositol-glycan biosynthesis class W protein isoform X2 [Gouania willdenowi]